MGTTPRPPAPSSLQPLCVSDPRLHKEMKHKKINGNACESMMSAKISLICSYATIAQNPTIRRKATPGKWKNQIRTATRVRAS